MEEKLENLYKECIRELENIGIQIENNKLVENIDIKIAKRNCKRYGCCKQEEPDEMYKKIIKRKGKILIKYDRFKEHHIEISKWVMDLNEDIIKNTIIHEIIHCLPECNNHAQKFKSYAKYINEKLGYNITTVGNKELDYQKSNLLYEFNNNKYKIICKKCGQKIYRQRLRKNFTKKYRCGKCGGKLEINYILDIDL